SKNLRYLITFAAGVFIIVSYNLFSESFEFGGSTLVLLFAAAAGGVVLEMLTRLVPDTHHHHGPGHEHAHTKTDARRLLMSDAIHNLVDGILLVPAFLIDVRLGFATLAAIFLHEVVQEISEFFVLKDAGYSTTYALTLNFTVSATILPGVIVGIFFLSVETLIAPLIAFAAGAFLYVVFRDLLPSTVRSIMRYGNPGMHLAAALTGIVVMFAVNAVMPHDPEGEAHAEPALQIPAQLR
ncbi:MAG: ZIP family metal transporter, partial [bacterium]|nr:ZIP family metal transporter [bacterium]